MKERSLFFELFSSKFSEGVAIFLLALHHQYQYHSIVIIQLCL